MIRFLRYFFHLLIVRPIVVVILGLNVRNRDRLPTKGPVIMVANHNSHLDTMVLFSLFPITQINHVRPVAAADYFLRNKISSWFSQKVLNILPIARRRENPDDDPLQLVHQTLERGEIVIFFPEGTRGDPEQMQAFRNGIGRLAQRHPSVPICPIYMQGLGKALPRNEAVLVPFIIDVVVGDCIYFVGDEKSFVKHLEEKIESLKNSIPSIPWS